MTMPSASAVLSLLMQLQFYIFDLHYASVFQRMLSPTGVPEQGFPIFDYVIPSRQCKTDIAEFLTCAFLVVN